MDCYQVLLKNTSLSNASPTHPHPHNTYLKENKRNKLFICVCSVTSIKVRIKDSS